MTNTWDTFNLKWGFEAYEKALGNESNPYRTSSQLALELCPPEGRVMDSGAGTGISGEMIVDANPNISALTLVEPAEIIHIARHKFGHADLFYGDNPEVIEEETGIRLTKEYLEFLGGVKRKLSKFGNRARFLKVPAQRLGDKLVEAGSIDQIYALSSFHWLAHNEKTNDVRPENVRSSLRNFYNALNSQGVLVFNESGLQMDFGDQIFNPALPAGEPYKGKQVNRIFHLSTDFHRRFVDELNSLIERRVGEGLGTNPDKINEYHGLFNIRNLEEILRSEGFRLRTLPKKELYHPPETGAERISYVDQENPERSKYLTTIMPKTTEGWEPALRVGGRMTFFNKPGLSELPNGEKQRILDDAYDATVRKHGDLMREPYGEPFATFIAEKIV